jgi:hypothetical protein
MPDFVEAAIYSVSKGPLVGQLVASCAQDKCGYFGKSGIMSKSDLLPDASWSIVFMGHIFNRRPGLPARSYEPRRKLLTFMIAGVTGIYGICSAACPSPAPCNAQIGGQAVEKIIRHDR